ncbi:MAG TPA: 2-hydroxyacid dehydrogenase [Terriglobales bacterium]|nr:2-hydroxyacid dehydrogenase [Terriglobales bacterium]
MIVKVGVDESVDEDLLKGFTPQAQLVRIPAEPRTEIKIDFWIPFLPPPVAQTQWPYLKGVQVVQAPWAGVDSLRPIFPPEVTLCDARGVHDIPTAELAVTLILAMQKNFPFYIQQQENGHWAVAPKGLSDTLSHAKIKIPPVPMNEVADATVLIVGYGSIGKAIEARLTPFGAKFLRVARSPREGVEPVNRLDELLGLADIIVLMMPLTSQTRLMMDAKRLAKMKLGALLVNVARGPIVDTDALLAALNEGRIRAALDVTDPEPLPDGHPLWKAPNLLITPHVAGDSAKFMKRLFTFASEQAERYARGEPLLNIVTGEY